MFGCLNLKKRKFYWKKSKCGDSKAFISFLTQLRQCFAGKELIIILDNYSIHKSRKVERYIKRFPFIHLFNLPTYSPEYNPVERIWGWVKPKVYGSSSVGGLDELVKRFRKIVWNFNEKKLVKPINLKLEAYELLL